MKLIKILIAGAMIASFTATAAFAAPGGAPAPSSAQQQAHHEKKEFSTQEDPVKLLESKKARIQDKLKEGKIPQEKADLITKKIDARIQKVKEFDKLSVQQKKDMLKSDFKASLDKRVKEGKVDQGKADELFKKFTDKVNQWDGKGYPRFFSKGLSGKGCHKK